MTILYCPQTKRPCEFTGCSITNKMCVTYGNNYMTYTNDTDDIYSGAPRETVEPPVSGWKCPECGNIYSPNRFECIGCNSRPKDQKNPSSGHQKGKQLLQEDKNEKM